MVRIAGIVGPLLVGRIAKQSDPTKIREGVLDGLCGLLLRHKMKNKPYHYVQNGPPWSHEKNDIAGGIVGKNSGQEIMKSSRFWKMDIFIGEEM